MLEIESDKLLVTFGGIFSIGFIYWFFFFSKKVRPVVVSKEVKIIVDGGYHPEVISVKKGETVTLRFLRKDPNPCLEKVIISDFQIRKSLPLGEEVTLEITPKHSGEFVFSCGMNMYRGKIVVTEDASEASAGKL